MIEYSLCWGLDIEIGNILFSDLVIKLTNDKKGREPNICYTRYLSLIIEHLGIFLSLPKETLILPSSRVNADDTTDKSLSRTTVQLITQFKAPTDKKSRKKKNLSSSQPKTSKIVRVSSPLKQVIETQHAEEPVTTADSTKGIKTSESAEELRNQTNLLMPKRTHNILRMKVYENIVEEAVKYLKITSLGNVTFEELHGHAINMDAEESPFDTELGIKFTRNEYPNQKANADQAYFDLEAMPDDKIVFVFDFEEADDDDSKNEEELSKNDEATIDNVLDELRKAQEEELAAYEAKRAKMVEEYNHCITFRDDHLPITKFIYKVNNFTKEATMRITRKNKPLNLMVYEKFVLKKLGFSKWLKLHALESMT
ncbi:hypothetical protein Tco_0795168 [Tanacetum coccineum]